MKLILCELLRLNFKHKNNIKRKRLWVWQIFMDRYSKGKFHVLVKELKLFDHELFFRHNATRYFDFSQRCLSLFCFINCYIQQFNWLIILSNNLFHFVACPKLKIFLSTKKFLKWTPDFIAWKEKIVNSCEYLLVENLLHDKFY